MGFDSSRVLDRSSLFRHPSISRKPTFESRLLICRMSFHVCQPWGALFPVNITLTTCRLPLEHGSLGNAYIHFSVLNASKSSYFY
jgi:hypothetical protein